MKLDTQIRPHCFQTFSEWCLKCNSIHKHQPVLVFFNLIKYLYLSGLYLFCAWLRLHNNLPPTHTNRTFQQPQCWPLTTTKRNNSFSEVFCLDAQSVSLEQQHDKRINTMITWNPDVLRLQANTSTYKSLRRELCDSSKKLLYLIICQNSASFTSICHGVLLLSHVFVGILQ